MTFRAFHRLLMLLGVLVSFASTAQSNTYQAKKMSVWSLNQPWALTQLPDNNWLVTEHDGQVVITGGVESLVRIPLALPDLYVAGQGGLLDLALFADFAVSGKVMLTFSQGTEEANHLAVASAVFNGKSFSDISIILTVSPDKDTPVHYGGRLALLPDSTWLVTTGDGFDYREEAQRLNSMLGKTLRFNADGSAPEDNPFAEQAPYVFTYGHRNPQGLVVDAASGAIYEHEHGPDGGDEINLLTPGKNYGWPVATFGTDYSGAQISPFTRYANMQSPQVNWTPSVAPSAMAIYRGQMFPELNGQLLVTTLKVQQLLAVDLSATPVQQTALFATINQRLRDVAIGHDGAIYVLTDGKEANILRIAPR